MSGSTLGFFFPLQRHHTCDTQRSLVSLGVEVELLLRLVLERFDRRGSLVSDESEYKNGVTFKVYSTVLTVDLVKDRLSRKEGRGEGLEQGKEWRETRTKCNFLRPLLYSGLEASLCRSDERTNLV